MWQPRGLRLTLAGKGGSGIGPSPKSIGCSRLLELGTDTSFDQGLVFFAYSAVHLSHTSSEQAAAHIRWDTLSHAAMAMYIICPMETKRKKCRHFFGLADCSGA